MNVLLWIRIARTGHALLCAISVGDVCGCADVWWSSKHNQQGQQRFGTYV